MSFIKRFGLLSGILILVASYGAYAQTVTVKGTVSDAVGPVIGAVVLSGNANAVTDIDGGYTIRVASNAVLEVSCLGYQTQQVPVNGRSVIDIVLQEDAMVLQEAVALGYGAQTKKKDLSASVGVVNNAEELASRPLTSATDMLQGQIPGVMVSSSSGDPTQAPSILIRGQGSQNGDSVLWVVDGVPGAPIVSMNDIESIVVLKDAASAAIYGATSGAGGVILVTTKKGKDGIHVEYDLVAGARALSKLPQSLDAQQMIEMRTRSLSNAGIIASAGYNPEVNPWIATTRTDWFKELFRTAFYQRHNVTLNYGSDKLKSRLTFNYQDNPGVLVSSYSKTLGVRANLDYQLNKWLKITEDLSYTHNSSRSSDTYSAYSGTILNAIYMPRSSELIQSAGPLAGTWGGSFTQDPEYFAQYDNYSSLFDGANPVRIASAYSLWNAYTNFWSTTGLEIGEIVKGLKFRSNFSIHVQQDMSKRFDPRVKEVGAVDNSNELRWDSSRYDTWRSESTLTYDRTFGKHTVGALGAVTFDHYNGRYFSLTGTGFENESDYLQYASQASSKSGNDGYSGDDANIALVARLAYSYADRYFVTASWRRDYAGRLPKDHKYGDFPAVTGAWKISNEPFFPKVDAISQIKLRASWGRIGNLGSIPMNYLSSVLHAAGWPPSELAAIYGVENNGRWGAFMWPARQVNNALTWETSEQTDLGLDIDLFKDRLSIGVDWYNKLTYNLIQDQSTGWPITIGWDPMKVNQGMIRNMGVEVMAGWNDKIGKDFSYHVSANFAWNQNRVVTTGILDDNGEEAPWVDDRSAWRMVPWLYRTEKGQPLESFYVIKTDGIFQNETEIYQHTKDGKLIQPAAQPGDLKFVDYNNDGIIDDKDRQYVGTAIPKYTFAFTAGFNWKDFNFSMMWQGVAGNKIAYVAKMMTQSDVEGNFNRSVEILNAWTPENPTTTIPRLSKNDPNGNFTTASDWYIEDGSYLRLKNVTVGYDFTRLLRKIPHFALRNSTASIYFSGENLFTITKYSGMDPECGGFDTMTYPVSRVFALGVKINY